MAEKQGAAPVQEDSTREIKQKIIEAASQLFEKKGLYETSVAEIAEEAGISVPVTYHYVKRKSDIMLLIMEDFTNKFIDMSTTVIKRPEAPGEKLRKAIELYIRLVDEDLVKVVLVYRKSRTLDRDGRKKIMADETEAVSVFEKILEEGIAKEVFRKVDTNLTAYNIIMSAHAWALKSWHLKKKYDLPAYIKAQTECIIRCISI